MHGLTDNYVYPIKITHLRQIQLSNTDHYLHTDVNKSDVWLNRIIKQKSPQK